MLKNVKFRPGINKHIFENLSKTVKEMQAKDRHCTLIFDKMSIQPA